MKKVLMYVYNWLGLIYYKTGNLNKSFFYYSKSLEFAEDLIDRVKITDMLYKISIVSKKLSTIYSERGDLNRAFEYIKMSIKFDVRLAKKGMLYPRILNMSLSGLLGIGDLYRLKKNFVIAENCFLECLNICKDLNLNDKSWEASTYEYLGRLYRDMEDKKLAKDYFSRAYDLFKSTGNEELAFSVLQELKMLK